MTKISDLSALTGAGVDAANDLILAVDMSEAGAARDKKMTFAELLVGLAAVPKAGGTMTGDLIVPDEAYDATAWNGNLEVPTKNAIRDKIESLATAYTDEQAQDAVAAAFAAGTHTNVTVTYNDAAGSISLAASGGGGGGAWNLQWSPMVAEFPSSNFATLDSRNNHPCLDFDTTTQETAYFTGVLPADYSGAGVTVHLYCALTSATTGTVGWDVAIERMDASSLDIDADSFGSATTVTAVTVPGTSGQLLKMSVNVSNGTNMDSLAAGEAFRLRVRRDVANDTAAGDAELLRVMMVSQ